MTETYDLFGLTTCEDTLNATSLRGSEAGPALYVSLDGQMKNQSGPHHSLVNRFRSQESKREIKIADISGPLFTNSSPSARLQQSLESNLRARLDVNGSPEYVLTWKHWDLPLGQPICALRASARQTSDSGFSGWATPTSRDWKDGTSAGTVPENGLLGRQVWLAIRGDSSTQYTSQTENCEELNPAHSRYLQGYPKAWDEAAPAQNLLRVTTKEIDKGASEDTETQLTHTLPQSS